jgi:hypothetical protein
MAWSTVDTHIQNPAKRTGKRMAKTRRKMSAKQIKHFGTRRQKAALKARRHAPATKRNPPKGGGRVISGYGSTVMNPRRKRRNPPKGGGRVISGYGSTVMNPRKRRKRNPGNHKIVINSARKRRNPTPMILSWAAGNPAKRSTSVAKSRKKKRVYATAKRSNAGRRPAKRVIHHRRRSNPGSLGRPMDWLQGGAGVIAGVVGTRAIPQMLLGASNTSYTGYAANAVAAVGLGWLTHMLFPNRQVLVTAVIAGGFAGLLSRIIADKTPFGAQLSLTGLGDHGFGLYQKSNFLVPQRVVAPRGPNSSMFTWGDGSQAIPMQINAGSDSTLAC